MTIIPACCGVTTRWLCCALLLMRCLGAEVACRALGVTLRCGAVGSMARGIRGKATPPDTSAEMLGGRVTVPVAGCGTRGIRVPGASWNCCGCCWITFPPIVLTCWNCCGLICRAGCCEETGRRVDGGPVCVTFVGEVSAEVNKGELACELVEITFLAPSKLRGSEPTIIWEVGKLRASFPPTFISSIFLAFGVSPLGPAAFLDKGVVGAEVSPAGRPMAAERGVLGFEAGDMPIGVPGTEEGVVTPPLALFLGFLAEKEIP